MSQLLDLPHLAAKKRNRWGTCDVMGRCDGRLSIEDPEKCHLAEC